jgi:hypothetical protein
VFIASLKTYGIIVTHIFAACLNLAANMAKGSLLGIADSSFEMVTLFVEG